MTAIYMEDRDVTLIIEGAKAITGIPSPAFIYKGSQTDEAFWTDVKESLRPFEKTRQNEIEFPREKWEKIAKGLVLLVQALGWEIMQVTGFSNAQFAALTDRINRDLAR